MGVGVLPECMFMYHVCTWCLWRSEEGTEFPGRDGCELPCEWWEQNLGSLAKHQVLLIADLSVSPTHPSFFCAMAKDCG